MKRYLMICAIIGLFSSCNQNEQVKVEYLATNAISEYTLYYQDQSGDLKQVTVHPESANDTWRYGFPVDRGNIVYLSGRYADVNNSLLLMIKVDGKIYKQGESQADTIKFLTVSGVVPFRD